MLCHIIAHILPLIYFLLLISLLAPTILDAERHLIQVYSIKYI
jgi:hypothetical protein